MFEMFKKKNKNAAKNSFQPSFGTVEDFASMRVKQNNNILVVNDDRNSIDTKCIIPSLMRGNLSYIVYDPNEVYHNALAQTLKDKGYDIQVLDLEDEENGSRIDLFEIVNITRTPYWISVILSGSIQCAPNEVSTAHNLFTAMMRYLLDTNQCVTIEDMRDLFMKIAEEDWQTIRDMDGNPTSRRSMAKVNSATPEIKKAVFEKVEKNFFNNHYDKLANPNIFTLTVHSKQTILFVKKVPKQYRGLATIMLFNLRVTSVMGSNKNLSTMVVGSHDDKWYNRALFAKVCRESELDDGHTVATMRIKKTIDKSVDLENNPIVVYMHSDDADTKEYIFDALKVKNQMNEGALKEISEKHFKGKAIPEDVLDSAPITMEELGTLQDCIVIDPARNARPFRCAEWVVG